MSEEAVGRRGLILILSSPSGAGKTTLTRALVDGQAGELSISVTTRPKRPSEIHGRHYHFIDVDQFVAMRDRNELLEWAEVHGNFYGTPRRPVEKALSEGRDMIFDIDYQGPLGHVALIVPADELSNLLTSTDNMVTPGTEHIDFDAELAALLDTDAR